MKVKMSVGEMLKAPFRSIMQIMLIGVGVGAISVFQALYAFSTAGIIFSALSGIAYILLIGVMLEYANNIKNKKDEVELKALSVLRKSIEGFIIYLGYVVLALVALIPALIVGGVIAFVGGIESTAISVLLLILGIIYLLGVVAFLSYFVPLAIARYIRKGEVLEAFKINKVMKDGLTKPYFVVFLKYVLVSLILLVFIVVGLIIYVVLLSLVGVNPSMLFSASNEEMLFKNNVASFILGIIYILYNEIISVYGVFVAGYFMGKLAQSIKR